MFGFKFCDKDSEIQSFVVLLCYGFEKQCWNMYVKNVAFVIEKVYFHFVRFTVVKHNSFLILHLCNDELL